MEILLPNLVPLLAAGAETVTHSVPAWARSNYFLEKFFQGGVVMYPIAAVFVVAVAVILERSVWWAIERSRRDANRLDEVYAALEQGNVQAASSLARGSKDPLIRTVWHGLNHAHASLEGSVLDTIITLAPLLGLLGTVTGIMAAFNAVNEGGLSPAAVSGGIGEALIATACGLGIAILTLIFFNFFNAKLAKLQFELESTSHNLVLMFHSLHLKANPDTANARPQPEQYAGSN
jgi:biopolymer transport protein ExbB